MIWARFLPAVKSTCRIVIIKLHNFWAQYESFVEHINEYIDSKCFNFKSEAQMVFPDFVSEWDFILLYESKFNYELKFSSIMY